MKVMVGGTFDPLHDGHKKLLERSFEIAGDLGLVTIGLSGDKFANRKNHPIRPFLERRNDLFEYLKSKNYSTKWEIEELSDRFGSTLEKDFDAIVVSEETFPTAVEINKLRKEKKMKKVDIHQITCVLAADGRWISSTRIWKGEIDVHGSLLKSKNNE
ncbi:phosphopantetheine adenylyltransferase [Methanomicrobium antiquum]|uniref:Phosphopantetheine adenylyltransferase n=1 Tax=Methanomicrobium antiquum TaxID=487686 RepID=A0AAF0FNC5_9EURY|nr:phosphopantetheine adenylyltransferase [Methanomicrobium antiquum]MDD3976529.1 phosphopantetheine adenylyltransferase [Methanomicrobium sp.]WFN37473.1 phosphopantetheine adenylyltransferase [Methanomicrobium antiquum]